MLYLKLKQAIDESAEKQRIAQESILEKQTVAIDKQTIALDKERDAREKGIERLNSILNRMEEKYFSKPPNSGNN